MNVSRGFSRARFVDRNIESTHLRIRSRVSRRYSGASLPKFESRHVTSARQSAIIADSFVRRRVGGIWTRNSDAPSSRNEKSRLFIARVYRSARVYVSCLRASTRATRRPRTRVTNNSPAIERGYFSPRTARERVKSDACRAGTPTKGENPDGSPAARKQHGGNVVEGWEVTSERRGQFLRRSSFSVLFPSPRLCLSFSLPPSFPPFRCTRYAGLTVGRVSRELYAVDSHREKTTGDIGAHGTSYDATSAIRGRTVVWLRSPAPRHWRRGRSRSESEAARDGGAAKHGSGESESEDRRRRRPGVRERERTNRRPCDGGTSAVRATETGTAPWPGEGMDESERDASQDRRQPPRTPRRDVAASSVSTFLSHYWLACRGCLSLGAHRSVPVEIFEFQNDDAHRGACIPRDTRRSMVFFYFEAPGTAFWKIMPSVNFKYY